MEIKMSTTKALIQQINKTSRRLTNNQYRYVVAKKKIEQYLYQHSELIFAGMLLSFSFGFLFSNIQFKRILILLKKSQWLDIAKLIA